MTEEDRIITLKIYTKKKMAKLDFMNAMANVVQIVHTDPKVNIIRFQVNNAQTFDLNLK